MRDTGLGQVLAHRQARLACADNQRVGFLDRHVIRLLAAFGSCPRSSPVRVRLVTQGRIASKAAIGRVAQEPRSFAHGRTPKLTVVVRRVRG
jgi:hypothetical protein